MDTTNFVEKYLNKDSLNDIFSRYFNKICRLKSIHVSHGNVGDGMLSVLKRIQLEWPENEISQAADSMEKCTIPSVENYPSSVIAKIRCNDKVTASDVLTNERVDSETLFLESLKLVHPNECNFYTLIAPRIKPRGIIPIPVCYTAVVDSRERGDGYILMEDLGAPMCHTVDVIRGFDKEHLMQIAYHLGKFHAWCLTTNFDWRPNFRRLEEFPNFVDFVKVLAENMLEQLREKHGKYFEKIDSNFSERILNAESARSKNRLEILGHGDMWIRNILWKSDGVHVGAFIDWQFANIGGLVDDLARVMTFSVRTEIRRTEERGVLSHYYQTLKQGLDESECGYSKEKISLPEFGDLFIEYQRRFAFDAFFDLCDFGILLEDISRIDASNANVNNNVIEMLQRASACLEDAQNLLKKFESK